MLKWFRDLKELVSLKNRLTRLIDDYETMKNQVADVGITARSAMSRVNDGVEEIRKRTDIHCDGAYYKNQTNTVILAGKYKDRDFVRVYNTSRGHFNHLVHVLKEENKYAHKGVMDMPEFCMDFVDRVID